MNVCIDLKLLDFWIYKINWRWKGIYILYIRSILDQSCVVWYSSLTKENVLDLKRVQKSAIRLILDEKYKNYEDGLLKANLESLKKEGKLWPIPLQWNVWKVKIQE